MIIQTGHAFVKYYNKKHKVKMTAGEVAHQVFLPLAFNNLRERHLVYLLNSAFTNNSTKDLGFEGQLLKLEQDIESRSDSSVAPGFPAENQLQAVQSFRTGFLDEYTVEDKYAAWIGYCLAFSINNNYLIFYTNENLLEVAFEAFTFHRTCMDYFAEETGEQLKNYNHASFNTAYLEAKIEGISEPEEMVEMGLLIPKSNVLNPATFSLLEIMDSMAQLTDEKVINTYLIQIDRKAPNRTLGYVKLDLLSVNDLKVQVAKSLGVDQDLKKSAKEFLSLFSKEYTMFIELVAKGIVSIGLVDIHLLYKVLKYARNSDIKKFKIWFNFFIKRIMKAEDRDFAKSLADRLHLAEKSSNTNEIRHFINEMFRAPRKVKVLAMFSDLKKKNASFSLGKDEVDKLLSYSRGEFGEFFTAIRLYYTFNI